MTEMQQTEMKVNRTSRAKETREKKAMRKPWSPPSMLDAPPALYPEPLYSDVVFNCVPPVLPPKNKAAVCIPAPPPFEAVDGNGTELAHAALTRTLLKVSLLVLYQI